MSALNVQGTTLAGTGLGALLCFVGQIQTHDLVKTTVLSIIGALISFAMSVGLRWLSRRVRKRK